MKRGGEVIRAFIELTENIANNKTNVLDFGSTDMTFYRGEIHMIKVIGDEPGIFNSEIARRFGITRAVVHKTMIKLESRGLVVKEQDPDDRKRHKLFLSEKGQLAYHHHEAYHEQYDKELQHYVESMSEHQLEAIRGFLEQANQLIKNHA